MLARDSTTAVKSEGGLMSSPVAPGLKIAVRVIGPTLEAAIDVVDGLQVAVRVVAVMCGVAFRIGDGCKSVVEPYVTELGLVCQRVGAAGDIAKAVVTVIVRTPRRVHDRNEDVI